MAFQFRVTSQPLFSVSPKFLYWKLYPTPETGTGSGASIGWMNNMSSYWTTGAQMANPDLKWETTQIFCSIPIIFNCTT